MGHCRLRIATGILLAVALAACGAGEPSAVPPSAASAARAAMPSTGGPAAATITVEPGVEADGPGESVSNALANADIGPQLVNGILLRAVDGSVWLCEGLLTSSPPRCAEPGLLVANRAQVDQAFVNGEGLHESDGIRWVENVQLFGVVRP